MTEVNEAPKGASPAGDGAEPLMKLRGIDKHFGPVQALYGVNLDLYSGNVTGLCGDNGAGKSVLTRTIAGVHHPDHGQIYFEGQPVHIRSTRDASALGIETVYQDLALADNLDIVQNMFLGHELLTHRLLDEATMERTAKQTLADLSVTTVSSVRQAVGSLSGGQRQSVAVARAVMRDARLVIMDEPTAALGVSQTAQVLELIRRLGARGISVLVVSHNLVDVFAVADRLAVLYLGQLVSSGPITEYDTQSAVELMTTGTLSHTNGNPPPGAPPTEPRG